MAATEDRVVAATRGTGDHEAEEVHPLIATWEIHEATGDDEAVFDRAIRDEGGRLPPDVSGDLSRWQSHRAEEEPRGARNCPRHPRRRNRMPQEMHDELQSWHGQKER